MSGNAPLLPKDRFRELRDYLGKVGFKFEERPHQVFLARAEGLTVSLYESGKVVIGGKDRTLEREVRWFLTKLGAECEMAPESLSAVRGKLRIGTDEAGKGDYFGPLVVAGVLIDEKAEGALSSLGVRDSKKLSAKRIAELAPVIMKGLGRERYEVLWLDPPRYNELYAEMGNLNRMLSWAHARVIENLLARSPECLLAVVDQFSARALGEALMEKGRGIRVVQSTGGERYIAVAAASILARDAFVRKLDDLGKEVGMVFPKGASAVEETARELVNERGAEALAKVAKLHFATTRKVVP